MRDRNARKRPDSVINDVSSVTCVARISSDATIQPSDEIITLLQLTLPAAGRILNKPNVLDLKGFAKQVIDIE